MRQELPGGSAELLDPAALNAGHQDIYQDLVDELREKRLAALPEPQPDPANPAVMPDPAERTVQLKRSDIRQLYDLVCGWVVQDCSFPGVAPWTPESRNRMPLAAWNKLREVIDDTYIDLIQGNAPKEKPATEPTSAPTF